MNLVIRRPRAYLTLALTAAWILGLALSPALAQQKVHEEYTKKILEFTTDPCLLTKYVNYMPYAEGVPTPLDVLGRIAGAKDVLSYSADIYKYMRALAAATPRVKVFDIGKTEEGRDWIVVAVADEETIKNLDKYKEISAKLADPRKLTEAEAQALLKEAKPIDSAFSVSWAATAAASPFMPPCPGADLPAAPIPAILGGWPAASSRSRRPARTT